MCGIVGIVRGPGAPTFSIDDVRRMADAIVHRGPDDAGFHEDAHAILGMRRLSIIDIAGGHQPIANEDESLHVVCNGEIYNFTELRPALERAGHRFRTHSDVEVLLHLYEQYGPGFVEHAGGMFGFALWDSRRKRLTLGRDRLGQKPVYYFDGGHYLAFASEIKALLALPQVRARVDSKALAEYLRLGHCAAPNTIFAGVRKLPPASVLVWQPDGWRIERYWSLPSHVREDLSAGQWVESIRAELARAVSEHMVSDVPIGAFLSGGLDSSAVVALMSRATQVPISTYAIGYAGDRTAAYYNELGFARQVARRFGTNHHEILVRPDVATLLPKLIWHLEEPVSDSAIITTYLVSQLAARTVKVILSGVGGDELFAGYRRYLGDYYARRYQRMPGWLRQRVLEPLAQALPSGRQDRVRDLARYARRFIESSGLPWDEQYQAYLEICSRIRVRELLARQDADADADADGFDRILQGESATDPLLRLMRVDVQAQLPEDLLLLTDKITMATSIECRAPFLDHRLAELAAQIPASLKLANGDLKHLLKRALQGVVPDEVLSRSKRGFGAPVGAWFKGQIRPLLDVLLARDVIERRGLLSWPAVQTAIAHHESSREDYSDLIMVLLNLEIWCRLFLDGRSHEDVSAELDAAKVAA